MTGSPHQIAGLTFSFPFQHQFSPGFEILEVKDLSRPSHARTTAERAQRLGDSRSDR